MKWGLKSIGLCLTLTLALAVLSMPVGAHPVPFRTNTEGYRCETVRIPLLVVHYCASPMSAMPDLALLKSIQAFMVPNYDITWGLETTVYIEATALNPKYRGAYFPPGGFIVVQDSDDFYLQAHTIAHELLHFIWHDRGVLMKEHHKRIYCEDQMAPIRTLIKAKDPYHRERQWVPGMVKFLNCVDWDYENPN